MLKKIMRGFRQTIPDAENLGALLAYALLIAIGVILAVGVMWLVVALISYLPSPFSLGR